MATSGDEKGYVYSKLVRINSGSASSKGDTGYSDTNFIVNLGSQMQNIWRVSVISVVFTNSAYNIRDNPTASPNALLRWSTAVSPGFTSIPPGFYSTAQLMSYIQNVINTFFGTFGLGQTITLSQDPISQKVLLSYNQGTSTAPSFSIVANANGADSPWQNLGFSFETTTVASLGVMVAENVPNLVGLRQVFLRSATLAPGNQIDEKGSWQNVLVAIPVTAAFGQVNVFECKIDQLCQITYQSKRNLSFMDFQLVDDKNNIVDLNGTTVKVELKVWADSL